uniref:Uncharacterized protein n=1 Tax=Heterosigma akashiwo TaxID=2829 RepID=A0A6V1TK39_HETAK
MGRGTIPTFFQHAPFPHVHVHHTLHLVPCTEPGGVPRVVVVGLLLAARPGAQLLRGLERLHHALQLVLGAVLPRLHAREVVRGDVGAPGLQAPLVRHVHHAVQLVLTAVEGA